jgi:hypothetical protein
MSLKARFPMSGVAALMLLTPTGGAWADAIDGNWCFADGRRLSIQGPELMTPGGKRMKGEYDRHAFAYVIPAGETDAGAKAFMVLIDDDTMLLKLGAQPLSTGEGETWKRCSERIS